MYVFLIGGIAQQMISDEDPVFPGVPIGDRYSAEFLEDCVHVDDSAEVHEGWEYRDGIFVEPEPPAEPEEPPDIPVPEPSADEIIDVLLGVTA